ncbi:sodium-dependent phosphate transport protein 2B isoform X2 [Patella vulgata]|uniref:sodium-dependent phosphate transport protein 2B isoform X2 n=1 Tax=Patella vulgata TaxID=6465 RepID=UPI0024A80E1E|nr:sodium-dependent phosphate transport protein 2B isoform X2 [Patella vulgata]
MLPGQYTERNGYDMEKGKFHNFCDGNEVVIEEEQDPWKVSAVVVSQTPFAELDSVGKVQRVVGMTVRVILVIACLYFFICSLDFLSSAFKLLGGKKAGEVFRNNDILKNPVAGLMMGVLVTVLVQSSSTSTSIIISMVGAQILPIRSSIPIIMGANIGTSVTNTIVALGQITNKNDFRRAFAGATVHDMFNWLAVIVLLPLEIITGYLFHLSEVIIKSLPLETNKAAKKDLLKVITKPFTELIIQVDSKGITKIATNTHDVGAVKLMKSCCDKTKPEACCLDDFNSTISQYTTSMRTQFCDTMQANCFKPPMNTSTDNCLKSWVDSSNANDTFNCKAFTTNYTTTCYKPCEYAFKGLDEHIGEEGVGAILLVVALAILCICLVVIVKMLHQLLRGQLAVLIKKFINAEFPGKMAYFTGYIAILLGAGLTILVQSSSIFTSTLTPLVGMGVIEIDRMYPLTLGANIGTTTTGLLSALAQDADTIADSLQVAFCHLFFNISGILIFYPFPFFRPPIPLAKFLGNQTAKYRWFAIVYIFCMFFIFPALIFALSVPGWYVLAGVMIPIVVFCIIVAFINCLQRKRPGCLPPVLRNWHFLPEPLRSLRPIDRCFTKCKCCRQKDDDYVDGDKPAIQMDHNGHSNGKVGEDNQGYVINTHL